MRSNPPEVTGKRIEKSNALPAGTLIDAQAFGRCEVIGKRGDWVNIRLRDCDAIWVRSALCRPVAGQRCHA